MEKLMEQIDALGEAIRQLSPPTAQQHSAINGVAHVRDNVRGHFEAVGQVGRRVGETGRRGDGETGKGKA